MVLDSGKPTLAIYGIQDRIDSQYPGYVHDHNMVLMDQGRVIKCVQLERISRNKRDNTLHKQITQLLRQEKLIGKEYDIVFVDNVVGKAFISTDGQVRFETAPTKKLQDTLQEGVCWWYDKEVTAWNVNHEIAHIFSPLPFEGEIKENSLLIHFDGGASLSNFSAWSYKDKKLRNIEYHWDLKYLSTLFNANALMFAIIGAKRFDQNSVPGKMMGYASLGSYSTEMEMWLEENGFFENIWTKKSLFFAAVKERWGIEINHFDQHQTILMDIVATVQHIFTRDTLEKIRSLQLSTEARYLYYSGGSALNIVCNTAIVESKLFRDVYIAPCCEDSGIALGAAAYVEWLKHGKVEIHSPFLNNWTLGDADFKYTDDDIEQVGTQILNGKVIALCNGYGEIGPRALGQRSIVALASSKRLAQKVSMEHKNREWYRPVAPIMLEKNACYFIERKEIHSLSKYMLLDFEIAKNKRAEIEGVVHTNGTARIQSVSSRQENPFVWDLLCWLDKREVKALINTSFNTQGEPIVHTHEGAIESAKAMNLDGVVIQGKLTLL